MIRRATLAFLITLATFVFGQAWSGIIDPSRATDWSNAGISGSVSGTVPSSSWTQCGTTIAPYAGTAATITSALAACGTNQYVLLGTGTFTLSTGINFPINTTGHVALRGAGANSTFLNFTGTGFNCGGFATAFICAQSSDGSYPGNGANTVYNWTAGYTQGATQITLSSVAGIVLNKTLLVLNQCDIGFSGSTCATGSATDNGNYFDCSALWNGTTGCSVNGPDGTSWRTNAWQTEWVTVTAINAGGCGATCVTISQPLKHPNWASGQNPQAVVIQPVPQDGIENLAIDGLASSNPVGIMFYNAYQGWVSGVRISNIVTWFINGIDTSHMSFQNNYLYHANCATGCDPYGIRIQGGGDDLTQNNIIQQIRLATAYDGPESGGVVAYNFSVNQQYASDFMFGAFWTHSAGDDFDLWEGNIGDQMQNDNLHGSHLSTTKFRNFFTGWESCVPLSNCGGFAKDSGTNAMTDVSNVRYVNDVGNVLGTSGYHTGYQTTTTPASNLAVFAIGTGNAGASPALGTDTVVATTMMRWGNYDVVNATNRFVNTEVPSGISPYPNPVPGGQALPASFYIASKPVWFGSLPWPPIGPDISGGNIGQCSGTLNSAGHFSGLPATSNSQCTGTSLVAGWAGHVNINPAMNCYLNVMGGVPDGTGNILPFDANTCYGLAPPPPPPPTTCGSSGINNFYVATVGNDNNPGTLAQPWATIDKSISGFTLGTSGACIHVAPGTYVGSSTSCFGGHTGFCINRGPTNAQASQPLIIQCDNGLNGNQGHPGAPGPCLLRDATDISTDQYTSIVTIAGVDSTILQGFDIGGANFAHSVVYINAKDGNGNFVEADHNFLHDSVGSASDEGNGEGPGCPPEGGIIINADNPATVGRQSHGNKFIGNFLNKLGAYTNPVCNQFHGMYVGPAVGITVYNNIIGNVPGSGIKVYGNVCSDNVSNNVVFRGGWWGILARDTGTGGCTAEGLTVGHATFDNNILIQNGVNVACGGIAEGLNSGLNKYANNLFIGNAPNDQVDTVGVNAACTTATPGGVSGTINGTTTTATLVNYQADGTGDYHLKAASPGINAGVSSCAAGGITPCVPPTDYVSNARPTGGAQDVGAYVFSSTGVPVVSFSPSPLNFGTVTVSATASLTATLTNTGTTNLTFTPATLTGTNPGDFNIVSTNCASPLGGGLSCSYNMSATPTATGARTANLTLNDNAAGSPHQLPLNVTGGVPGVTFNPTSLAFGTIIPSAGGTSCSAVQTYTVTSSGSAPMTMTLSQLTGPNAADFQFGGTGTCHQPQTYAPGASCTISVKLCPLTSGAKTAAVSLTTDAPGSPQQEPLTGAGGSSTATLLPTTFNYGNQQLGTSSAAHAFTYTNTGTLALNITNVTVNSSSYSVTDNCPRTPTTLAPAATCTVNAVFKPVSVGVLSAVVTVTGDATQTSSVTGTGTQANITLSPTTVNFGSVLVGSSSNSVPVTITNNGTASAIIGSVTTSAQFAQTNNCPGTLGVGASCTANVTFVPTAVGLASGALTVADNAPGNPHTAALSGTGTSAIIAITPTSNNFGNQAVGTTTTPFNFTYTNSGTGPVVISSVGLTGTNPGDFAIASSTCTTATPALSDTFSTGTLDATKWVKDTGNSPAPGPNNTATFSTANVSLAQGQLELILTQAAGTPIVSTGAEVRSINTFGYGTYTWTGRAGSTSATPAGAGSAVSGQVTGMFNYFQNNGLGAPNFTEDDFEIEGQFLTQLEMTSWSSASPVVNTETNSTQSGMDAASHQYKYVWLPGSIAYSFDGTLVSTHTTNVPSAPAFVIHNFYGTNSGTFGGTATTGVTRHLYISNFSLIPALTIAGGQSCNIGVTFKPTTSGARSATVSVSDSATGSPHTAAVTGTGVVIAPAVSLSTTSINFGNQPVGTTSGTRPITVTNTGTANLVISSATTGANFTASTACATVTPGNICTVNVAFAPTVAGTLTGTLSIASNAASSPDLVSLQGFGTQAGATLTPTTVNFGTVVVGVQSAGSTLTLSNIGNVSLTVNTPTMTGANPTDFTFSGGCTTLAVNASCTYLMFATPGGAGARTGTFNQTFGNGVAPLTVALSVTGQATAPAVTLTPTSIDFGSTTQGTATPTQTIQLTNSGTANLTVTSVTATGTNPGDVNLSVDNCTGATVLPGRVCTVNVSMTPASTGARSANAHFITNAASSPDNTTLVVIGLAAPAPQATFTPSTTIAFGNVKTNTTSVAQVETVGNIGNADLAVSSVTLGGANPTQYSQTNSCGTVIPNSNCAVTVNCTPTSVGSKPATLVIVSNDPTTPTKTINLTCTGKGHPRSRIGVTSINFGNTITGTTSAALAFTITNVGDATLNVSNISTAGDTFPQNNTCVCCPVAPAASCTVNVQFAPQLLCGQFDLVNNCISNVHLGSLTVTSDADESPQTIALAGTALPIPPPPGPITITVGGVAKLGGGLIVGVQ